MRPFCLCFAIAVIGCHASEPAGSGSSISDDFPMTISVSDTTQAMPGIAMLRVRQSSPEFLKLTVQSREASGLFFNFQNDFTAQEMGVLMAGGDVVRDFPNPVEYSTDERVRRFRVAQSFSLESRSNQTVRMRIELGEVDGMLAQVVYDAAPPTGAESSAVVTTDGVPSILCTDEDDVGRAVDDPGWESEFCSEALQRFQLQALVGLAP